MSTSVESFADLGLSETLLQTLTQIGYETPSPIQAQCIPVLLEGHDLIGMAQTGTGKTAAFALPLMEQIDVKLTKPQALILTPTRELAIQVAEALQSYAKNLPGFHVLPIYGGEKSTETEINDRKTNLIGTKSLLRKKEVWYRFYIR